MVAITAVDRDAGLTVRRFGTRLRVTLVRPMTLAVVLAAVASGAYVGRSVCGGQGQRAIAAASSMMTVPGLMLVSGLAAVTISQPRTERWDSFVRAQSSAAEWAAGVAMVAISTAALGGMSAAAAAVVPSSMSCGTFADTSASTVMWRVLVAAIWVIAACAVARRSGTAVTALALPCGALALGPLTEIRRLAPVNPVTWAACRGNLRGFDASAILWAKCTLLPGDRHPPFGLAALAVASAGLGLWWTAHEWRRSGAL